MARVKGYWEILVLLLGFLALAHACAFGHHNDPCSLRQVRGCGSKVVEAREPFWSFKCDVIKVDSVVALTLTDVIDLNDSYLFLMEMPGVETATVEVEYVNNIGHVLSVRGVNHDVKHEEAYRERGAFTKLFGRKFILPQHADVDSVTHELSDGLLKVTVPVRAHKDREEEEALDMEVELEETGWFRLPPRECVIERADEFITPEPVANAILDCSGDDSVIAEPLMDKVTENDAVVVFIFEMPGVKSRDVEVAASGSVLSVTGVARDEAFGKVLRMDRGAAPTKVFTRKLLFWAEDNVDLSNVTYQLSGDGLLKVTVPKVSPNILSRWLAGWFRWFDTAIF